MRQTILVILAAAVVVMCGLKAFGHHLRPRPSARIAAAEMLERAQVTGSWTTLAPPTDPLFTDVANSMGLTMIHDNGERGGYRLHEIIGPGVGFVDHDGDGDLDIFVTGGGPLDDPDAAQPCRLYRNDRDRFTDVTDATNAGVPGHAFGVAVADYDDDGDEDVFITRSGPDVLLRNDGGVFARLSEEVGLRGRDNGTSATFLDYDLDGDLDLYVTNYVIADDETRCYSILGVRDFCGPTAYPPSRDRLYRNEGDGTFLDASAESGIASELGNGLGVVASDFDGDGWVDLYVANDQSPAFFWHNQGDGTFESAANLRGCAYDRHGVAIAGMGIASEDFDGDGDFDLIVTNIRSETHLVLQNDGGYFTDTGARMGIGRWSMDMTAFGIVIFDQDLDGGLDGFIANGDVTLGGPAANPDNPFSQPDQFVRLTGGKFVDATWESGVAHGDVGRAAAAADFDNDGDLDLLVSNNAGPFRLFRNNTTGGSWLMVDPRTGPAARTAFNAVITVRTGDRTQIREIRPQQSYLSSGDPRAHFGLGGATVADEVVIRWPDGSETVRRDVAADQVLRVVQEAPRS